jgi:hypothetical protein
MILGRRGGGGVKISDSYLGKFERRKELIENLVGFNNWMFLLFAIFVIFQINSCIFPSPHPFPQHPFGAFFVEKTDELLHGNLPNPENFVGWVDYS